MKRLLASTALVMLAAGPLAAQDTAAPADEATADQQAGGSSPAVVGVLFISAEEPETIYGSDLMGMSVYSSESDYAADYGAGEPVTGDVQAGWDDIGEVNDILITPQGEVQGVLVDVGGFLGLGEHTVALNMDQVHFLRDAGDTRFIAVNSTEEELENAPEYQRQDQMAGMTADTAAPGVEESPGMMAANPAATGTGMGMARPTYQREGYSEADYAGLTADELQGAAVYDGNDENIGNVDELILADDGSVEQAVVDVGGFLGMGEHSVAMPLDGLQVMTNEDGSDVRVYVDQTREQLEQMPAYEG
jgi:uncharacterized protein YrrD